MATIDRRDLIDGAGFELGKDDSEITRVVYLNNFESDPNTQKQEFLFEAVETLADAGFERGEPYSTAHDEYALRSIGVYPASGNACMARLRFKKLEINGQDASGGAALIEQGTMETSVTTSFIPGSNRIPIQMSLTNPAAPQKNIPKRGAEITVIRSIRYISVMRILKGTPDMVDTAIEDVQDTVNNATWRNRPPGHWRLARVQVLYSKYPGWYTVNLQAQAKKGEDWSVYVRLKQQKTGEWAEVDPMHMTALQGKAYAYGEIGTDITDYDKFGVLRIGPYEPDNFATIFGF